MKDEKKLQKENLEQVKGGTVDVIHSRWAMLGDKWAGQVEEDVVLSEENVDAFQEGIDATAYKDAGFLK